jgi:NAD(P)-dependent dehydrogenase (short-subunit alcohol dehydrogenase family)
VRESAFRVARTLVVAEARVVALARRPTELGFAPGPNQEELVSIQAGFADYGRVVETAGNCLEFFDGQVDILMNNAAYLAAGVKAGDVSREDTEVAPASGHPR